MTATTLQNHDLENTATKIPTKKILLWIAMASMVMLFAGLTSGYLVRHAEGNWLEFEMPSAFFISTFILLASSITIQLTLSAAKKQDKKSMQTMLILTLGLGLAFVFFQFEGWENLTLNQVFFSGKLSNPAGSFFYVLTGLHMAHLAGGLLSLVYGIVMVTRVKSWAPKNLLSLQLIAIFWHFLDGLWLYLFLFLLLVR